VALGDGSAEQYSEKKGTTSQLPKRCGLDEIPPLQGWEHTSSRVEGVHQAQQGTEARGTADKPSQGTPTCGMAKKGSNGRKGKKFFPKPFRPPRKEGLTRLEGVTQAGKMGNVYP